MQTSSFVALAQKSKAIPLYLVHAITAGKAAWYYIEVSLLKKSLLDAALKKHGAHDLSAFGTIVLKGWGEEPSAGVKKLMAEKYGIPA